MEDEDHLRLLPRLQLEGEHRDLDGDRSEHQEIVAGEPGALRVEEMRADQQRQHQRAEQARPALLDAEAGELVERVSGGPALGPFAEAGLGLDERGRAAPRCVPRWRRRARGGVGTKETRGNRRCMLLSLNPLPTPAYGALAPRKESLSPSS